MNILLSTPLREMSYAYPTDMEISYGDSREYRESLRGLFHMNMIRQTLPEDYDEETADEMDYDSEAATAAMDFIYTKTRDHELFRELYTAAAGRMFSTDHETGMAVLMSYDYLEAFHGCLVVFFRAPADFTRTAPCFAKLHRLVA